MSTSIITAAATRQGTEANNADAAAVHHMPGTDIVAAAIVDGIGHAEGTPEWARIAAEVAARVGARRTATIGILAAAELNAAPGADAIEPDGVAVVALAGISPLYGAGFRRSGHSERGVQEDVQDFYITWLYHRPRWCIT